MRLANAATVVDTDLQFSAGNRRQSRSVEVLRGCEGPRSVAKVASDPGAPSHFSEQRAAAGATENAHKRTPRPPAMVIAHVREGVFLLTSQP